MTLPEASIIGDHRKMSPEFAELWAAIREGLAARGNLSDLHDQVARLQSLKSTDEERIRSAAVGLQLGVAADNGELRRTALTELRATPPELASEVLSSFPDLTILGLPSQRWMLLDSLSVGPLLDPTDEAIRFIRYPTEVGARELLSTEWCPPDALPENLRSELKLHVGWAAIDLKLEYRSEDAHDLLFSPGLRLRPRVEPGWWEQQLQKAVASLIEGDERAATSLVEAIDRWSPPFWAQRQVAYCVAKFAPLASNEFESWSKAAKSVLPSRKDAVSQIDRVALTMTAMLHQEHKTTRQAIADLSDVLASYPWLNFAGFCNSNMPAAARTELAQRLTHLDLEDFNRWHWCGRDRIFATHVGSVKPEETALVLAAAAYRYTDSESIAEAIADLSNNVPARSIAKSDEAGEELREVLSQLLPQLSTRRQSLLGRGCTYRAILDGSNIMWAGRDKRYGGKPKLKHLEQAMEDLAVHGFEDLVIYTDSATQYQLANEEKERLKKYQNDYKISIVHGQADPLVIRAFLEDPEVSEMVTCDLYRVEMEKEEYAKPLKDFSLSKWRRFHLRGGKLEWATPLNERPSHD